MRVLGLFIVVLSAFSSYGESVVKKIGENVFVSSDIDGANTISIQFKRCMANELYTFYNVSLISGGRTTTVNSAYSDNIGPYLIANSGWCGGNHLYSDNKTHTAYTVFVECLADGRALEDGETVNARKTVINVENVIYNPRSAQNNGGTVTFTDILCKEFVTYTVIGGCIQVDLRHEYENTIPVTVERYYGMQSMFEGEDEILTPLGEYCSWTPLRDVSRFTKDAYPEFRWFVERNDKCSQSAYLFNRGLGSHCDVAGNDVVFIGNSYNKSYHKQIGGAERKSGDSDCWSGVYSWFVSPLRDDGGVFACRAIADGEDAVVVSCYGEGEYTVDLPEYLCGRKIGVVEKSSGIQDVSCRGNELVVKTDAEAVVVVAFDAGDGFVETINGDGEALCVIGGEGSLFVRNSVDSARIYTIDGRMVAEGNGQIECPKGLYVVAAAGEARKVMVR